MIERSAFLGGCDGVAGAKSAEFIGEEPVGTMPHALILVMGDTVEATKAFHEIIPEKVARVALIDTFHDEKFAALEVAESLGKSLYGVRLDTPSSRRGDFLKIIEEVRWELDLRGFQDVRIFASGNIDAETIRNLNPAVDAYGVGTHVSNAPVIDFSMDIVEIEGGPIAKRGKISGRKRLYRCPDCYRTLVQPRANAQPACTCGGSMECLIGPLITDGIVAADTPRPQQIREYVVGQLSRFSV
jgi:nicotinate phosphoribosyltransferase